MLILKQFRNAPLTKSESRYYQSMVIHVQVKSQTSVTCDSGDILNLM